MYIDIITALIKENKLSDYDFSINILSQLNLENINIPFMISESLFQRMLEILNINNEYIKEYIINDYDDINDIKKINFYYLLLKFIFKSSFYIYNIPLLYEAHKKMIEILKSKKYFSLTIKNQIIIERIEYVIKQLCDTDYYFNLNYLTKKKNIGEIEKDMYIKSNLLKNSIGIFNISIQTNKSLIINKIEFIYEENKTIKFEEIIKLKEKKKKMKIILN